MRQNIPPAGVAGRVRHLRRPLQHPAARRASFLGVPNELDAMHSIILLPFPESGAAGRGPHAGTPCIRSSVFAVGCHGKIFHTGFPNTTVAASGAASLLGLLKDWGWSIPENHPQVLRICSASLKTGFEAATRPARSAACYTLVIPTGAKRSRGIWLRTGGLSRLWPDPSTSLRSARGDKKGIAGYVGSIAVGTRHASPLPLGWQDWIVLPTAW